ncbi:MAG: response regulator transcription factor [Chloroflexota bacterium]
MAASNPATDGKSLIRVVLADDHPLIRQAVRMWLEMNEDIKVVAEACDGKEALEVAIRLNPDVVILDVSMPKLNGLEATRQIVSRCPGTKVLALTVHTDNETIRGMLQAGASGYLTKTVLGNEVVHLVRAVCAGESVLPTTFQNDQNELKTPRPQKTLLNDLTPRELKILRLVAGGYSNKEIATRMGMSLRGVKAVLTVIYMKLGASSRTEATAVALSSGILSLNDLKRSTPR